jgi:hypothetical protein
MAERAIYLMKRYGNVRAVFVDNAIPIFGTQLRQLCQEPVNYQENWKTLEQWGYSEQSIYRRLRIHSVNFINTHKQMLSNMKWFVNNEVLRINPKLIS